jgi:hypothetical protein
MLPSRRTPVSALVFVVQRPVDTAVAAKDDAAPRERAVR